jgi:succinate dehydrogenase hydrophobic anchor subunit
MKNKNPSADGADFRRCQAGEKQIDFALVHIPICGHLRNLRIIPSSELERASTMNSGFRASWNERHGSWFAPRRAFTTRPFTAAFTTAFTTVHINGASPHRNAYRQTPYDHAAGVQKNGVKHFAKAPFTAVFTTAFTTVHINGASPHRNAYRHALYDQAAGVQKNGVKQFANAPFTAVFTTVHINKASPHRNAYRQTPCDHAAGVQKKRGEAVCEGTVHNGVHDSAHQ